MKSIRQGNLVLIPIKDNRSCKEIIADGYLPVPRPIKPLSESESCVFDPEGLGPPPMAYADICVLGNEKSRTYPHGIASYNAKLFQKGKDKSDRLLRVENETVSLCHNEYPDQRVPIGIYDVTVIYPE